MPKIEQSINKLLIGIVIGSTIAGIGGLSTTEKGRSLLKSTAQKLLGAAKSWAEFIKGGLEEIKKASQQRGKSDPTDPEATIS